MNSASDACDMSNAEVEISPYENATDVCSIRC